MEWPIEDTFKIINLYQQFSCLWDYQSSLYKRIDLKKNAWEEIARSMEKTVEVVKKKMKHLRSAYLLEKKVDNSKKSGSSADGLYVPHLYYYTEMGFLGEVVSLRQTSSSLNLSQEEPELIEFSPKSDLNDSFITCSSQASFMSSKSGDLPTSQEKITTAKKRKEERYLKINSALDEIIKKAKDPEEGTVFSHFGVSVGMQLGKMEYAVALNKMSEIQAILSKAAQTQDSLKQAMLEADII